MAELPLSVSLARVEPAPLYQRVAHEAHQLRRLSLSLEVIATHIGVDAKTIAKAVAWREQR